MTRLSNLFSSIPHLTHGFGALAQPIPEAFAPSWERRAICRQVHGGRVVEALYPEQDLGEADALFSAAPGIPIAVQTADCVPVLLARKDGRAVAAVHAGWRGTRARILRALWERLSANGESPGEWVAAIGPAIGPCCYEVSPELASDFEREFERYGKELVLPRPRYLDLPAINEAELQEIGLAKVELIRACTFCSVGAKGEPLFHSYRREKAKTRQWSGLMISPQRVAWGDGRGRGAI